VGLTAVVALWWAQVCRAGPEPLRRAHTALLAPVETALRRDSAALAGPSSGAAEVDAAACDRVLYGSTILTHVARGLAAELRPAAPPGRKPESEAAAGGGGAGAASSGALAAAALEAMAGSSELAVLREALEAAAGALHGLLCLGGAVGACLPDAAAPQLLLCAVGAWAAALQLRGAAQSVGGGVSASGAEGVDSVPAAAASQLCDLALSAAQRSAAGYDAAGGGSVPARMRWGATADALREAAAELRALLRGGGVRAPQLAQLLLVALSPAAAEGAGWDSDATGQSAAVAEAVPRRAAALRLAELLVAAEHPPAGTQAASAHPAAASPAAAGLCSALVEGLRPALLSPHVSAAFPKGAHTGKGKGAHTGGKGKGAHTGGKGNGAHTDKGKGAHTGRGKGAHTGKEKPPLRLSHRSAQDGRRPSSQAWLPETWPPRVTLQEPTWRAQLLDSLAARLLPAAALGAGSPGSGAAGTARNPLLDAAAAELSSAAQRLVSSALDAAGVPGGSAPMAGEVDGPGALEAGPDAAPAAPPLCDAWCRAVQAATAACDDAGQQGG
jgi:hypothetical protein